jgi:hypothetical protein
LTIGEVFSETVKENQHITEGFQQGKLAEKGTVRLSASRQDANTVVVHWKKVGYVNAVQFNIQRKKVTEEHFETIATINNSIDQISFEYADANNEENASVYRVQYIVVEKDALTNEATVEGTPKSTTIQVFPNPTTEEINIQVGAAYEKIIVKIFDNSGKMLYRQNFNTDENTTITIESLDFLKQGTYILQLFENANSIGSQAFVKL